MAAAATFSENGLFSGTESSALIRLEGYTAAGDDDLRVRYDQVGPGYFTGVGIPVLLGRDFSGADHASAPPVVVINQQMARFYFGDRNPIGEMIHIGGATPVALAIVGVSANARDHSLRDEVFRRMYVPFLQPIDGLTGATYEVRADLESVAIGPLLRAAVADVAPRLPITSMKPVTTLIDESLLRERMIARLSVLFGLLAAILASVGLYGILAYSVVRRTNEIGIRMAIGAFRRDIVWMILRETLALAAAGVLVGVLLAVGLARYVASLLFGLTPVDPVTIAAVVGLMTFIACLAAIAPSRRAAGIDPLRALRYE